MTDILISGVAAAVSVGFAVTVNRYTSVLQTVMCCLFPVLFGWFAWDSWVQWQSAPPNPTGGGYPYSVEFVSWSVATAIFLIALGRRIAWLRHNKHTGWTRWS